MSISQKAWGILLVLVLLYSCFSDPKITKTYTNEAIKLDKNLFSNLEKYILEDDFILTNSDEALEKRIVGDFLFLKGVINSNSYKNLVSIFERNPSMKNIVLTYIEGSMDDEINFEIGKYIYDNNYNMILPKKGKIYSGGVDLFLSAKKRFLKKGAKVGVHSWADDDQKSAKDFPQNHQFHKPYLNYYNYINIPKDFYWFTIETDFDKIHIMNDAELEEYKIYTQLYIE